MAKKNHCTETIQHEMINDEIIREVRRDLVRMLNKSLRKFMFKEGIELEEIKASQLVALGALYFSALDDLDENTKLAPTVRSLVEEEHQDILDPDGQPVEPFCYVPGDATSIN